MTIIDDNIEIPIDENEPTFESLFGPAKTFKRERIGDRFQRIPRVNIPAAQSKSGAASIYSPIQGQQQKTILSRNQLMQCADAYTNDGIVRTAINKHIDYILGKRTKFGVELNEELTEFANDEEKDKLKKELDSPEVQKLRTNIIRVNKRVHLHERVTKLLQNVFIYGRGALQIIRFPSNNTVDPIEGTEKRPPTESESKLEGMQWSGQYGEPQALLPLNTIRIVEPKVNSRTGELSGLYYDYGIVNKTKQLIPSIELIPAFMDDINLYENTLYSGMSPIWPVLNVVMANQIINDEDLPEAAKQLWAKYGFVYAGSGKASVTARIKDQLQAGTTLVHNQEKLNAQVFDLGRDIRELVETRKENAMFILQCLGIPVYFLFEDNPNHATAIASQQAYKVSTLQRHRTWVRDILETYWYDPILADHLNVSVEDVISEKIKVRAILEDVVFDIFRDQVSALVSLHNAGIYDDEKVLKELGADDVWARKREMEAILEKQALEDAKAMDELKPGEDESQFDTEMKKIQIQKEKNSLTQDQQGKGFIGKRGGGLNKNKPPFTRR